MIVRGRHSLLFQEGKDKILFRSFEVGTQGLGGFEVKGAFTDMIQLSDKVYSNAGR